MHPKFFLSVFFFLISSLLVTAQNKNPYESIGKKGKILTLSNGKYEELFDQDSIQQIGSVLVNIRTHRVVKLLSVHDAKQYLENTKSSRFLSVDPLSNQFPFYSPYQYAGNKPIWATDLDGAEELILPRIFFPRPVLNLPKLPPVPVQPLPPLPPAVPSGFSMPQTPTLPPGPYMPLPPPSPSLTRSTPFDESNIDSYDATTWPTPPKELGENWKVSPVKPGDKGYEKLKDRGATRLEDEEGGVLRWHSPDKYHPKGHWDYKNPNLNKPLGKWENWTPDGIQIPEGKIYGKDFNPAINPFSTEYLLEQLRRVGEQREYEKKMKQYEKDLKQYEKKKKEYDKKWQEYIKENPDLIA